MFRFTVREVMLITALVSISVGWWISYCDKVRIRENAKVYREELQEQLDWREHESGIGIHVWLANGERMESNTDRTFFPTAQ